jgi:hypothetical protein
MKFGWDDGRFWFKHSKAERINDTFRNECIDSVKKIRERTDKTLLVNMSGGIDSEMIARSLLLADISFTAQIWVYEDNLNDHDITYAIKFCESNNIPIRYLNINIKNFFEKTIYEITEKWPTPFWAMPLQQYVTDLTPENYYSIFGEGHLVFHMTDPEEKVNLYAMDYKFNRNDIKKQKFEPFLFEMECATNVTRYMNETGKTGCPRFFKYTPEIMLAYMRHPIVSEWMKFKRKEKKEKRVLKKLSEKIEGFDEIIEKKEKRRRKRFSSSSFTEPRSYMFHQEFPEMEKRMKYSGMEKIDDLKQMTKQKLKSLYPLNKTNTYLIPFTYSQLENALKVDWDWTKDVKNDN